MVNGGRLTGVKNEHSLTRMELAGNKLMDDNGEGEELPVTYATRTKVQSGKKNSKAKKFQKSNLKGVELLYL